MIHPDNVPPVDDSEILARFIVNSNEYRKDNDTVRPKLFMPFKWVDLSVNRHRECSEDEIWQIGVDVSKWRQCSFYGRSDIAASACRIEPLRVVERPLEGNSNHAEITDFPPKKEDQMSLAIKLAASASKRIPPPVR